MATKPRRRAKRRRNSRQSEVKCYTLLQTMHLGYCKDTFPAGSKIEHHVDDDMLVINGRPFDDTRDLNILLRKGWVSDYDEEVSEVLIAKSEARKPKRKKMPVVEADEDAHPVINIKDTQVGKNAAKERERGRNRTRAKTASERRSEQLDIIRGDEDASERRKRLLAELAELDGEEAADDEGGETIRGMRVDRTSDYGYGYGGKKSSLNAGATVGRKQLTAEELEQMREEGKWKASEGIDTRNEVRAKMGLPPLPPKKLKGKDSSGAAAFIEDEELEEEDIDLEEEGTFMDDEEAEDMWLKDCPPGEEDDEGEDFDVELDEADDEAEFEEFEDDGIARMPVRSSKDVARLISALS